MPRFIPLNIFKELYTNETDILDKESHANFITSLQNYGEGIAGKAGYSLDDFKAFQNSILTPSGIVFHGWVGNIAGLTELLVNGKLEIRFVDKNKYLEHQLGLEFKKFISPFLANQLLALPSGKLHHLAFSYTKLLDVDHCAVVENELFKPIQKRLDDLKQIKKSSVKEQELVNAVKPVCSDEVIESVNDLSRASYAKKLAFVDGILDMIRSKACTVRFANWILKQLERVELNREHEYKITDLREDLKRGELTVRNKARGQTPIRFRAIFSTLIILALIGFAGYVIYFKPFSTREDEVFTNNTSFKEFTKEERQKIDSLVKEISHDRLSEEIEIDPTNPIINGGISLKLRKAFLNEKMERIYSDLNLDADLKINYPKDSCDEKNNLDDFKRNDGILDLNSKTSGGKAMLKNESDYSIIVYVAEDQKGGKVYSTFVKSGETIEFKIARTNSLMIVAGNDYQKFTGSQHANQDELPSKNFNYHFCNTDQNYDETINTTYQLQTETSTLMKFMVTGTQSGYVHLIDLHGVLADY